MRPTVWLILNLASCVIRFHVFFQPPAFVLFSPGFLCTRHCSALTCRTVPRARRLASTRVPHAPLRCLLFSVGPSLCPFLHELLPEQGVGLVPVYQEHDPQGNATA